MTYDLFVIGGGSGGVRCARIAAELGARVGIAEQRFWGGTCVNVGCVPKKLMVQAADYGAAAQDARGFGWHANQCDHDWAAMTRSINAEVAQISAVYRSMLTRAGVDLFDSHAALTGPNIIDLGTHTVTARHIVIATGGAPVVPKLEGHELGAVSDAVFTLPTMPRRVTILGGGYIGVEFAGVFAGLGAEVDLVFRQSMPLRGFDEEIRAALVETLGAEGVRLHPLRSIGALRRTQDGAIEVTCTDGAIHHTDFVLYATGRRANTNGLGLAAAGVTLGPDGAIPVDCDRRTNIPHIFAIGDAVDHVNLTPVALAHGHILATMLFGDKARNWNFDAIPTAVFSRPPIATVGLSEEAAAQHTAADIYLTHFTPLKHKLTGRAHHRSCLKLVVDQATQRLLGAHMMGDDAPEIIQGLAIAITAGATKQDVDTTLGIHPTSAEEFVTMRARARTTGLAQAAE